MLSNESDDAPTYLDIHAHTSLHPRTHTYTRSVFNLVTRSLRPLVPPPKPKKSTQGALSDLRRAVGNLLGRACD
jgi:hypothetical protein